MSEPRIRQAAQAPGSPRLQRRLGLFGAIMMGLGAMVGTGVFVSIGIAAGIAGPSAILAIVLAALVAICNGLSIAQLAASHPVSGGTYEYGYQYLNPWLGFTAGWMFLVARSASAATAALGFAGYTLGALDLSQDYLVLLALAAVIALTLVALSGIHRSHVTNVGIVSMTLLSLLFFVMAGPAFLRHGRLVGHIGGQLHAVFRPERGRDRPSRRIVSRGGLDVRGLHGVWTYRYPGRGSARSEAHASHSDHPHHDRVHGALYRRGGGRRRSRWSRGAERCGDGCDEHASRTAGRGRAAVSPSLSARTFWRSVP